MSATLRKKRAARQKRFFQEARRIKKRHANTPGPERPVPMMTATNIHYEHADRVRGLSAGGIGAILLRPATILRRPARFHTFAAILSNFAKLRQIFVKVLDNS